MRAVIRVTLALICVVMLPLGALEVGMRYREATPAYVWEPGIGILLKPNEKRTFRRSQANGGKEIVWTTNSKGLRGQELDDSSEFRILVYGDSNIQARFSNTEDTFTYLLQSTLHQMTSRSIEVVNAGVVGAGPDQNLLRMHKDLKEYHPNLVLFHLFADNDYGDLIRNRLFRTNAHGELVRSAYEPTNDISFLRAHPLSRHLRLRQWLMSEKPRKNIPESLKECQADYETYQSDGRGPFDQLRDDYDFDLALFPELPSSRAKVELMGAVLKEIAHTARQARVSLALSILPSARDLTQNHAYNYRDFEKYSARYRRERLSTTLEKLAQSSRIPTLNLYPIFLAKNPETLYFAKEDNHWNDEGQKLAALVVAKFLLSEGLVGAGVPRRPVP